MSVRLHLLIVSRHAAFDAVFLLHHANIDRLLSLWQAMNPEDWVTHGTQPGGTHTIEDGGTVDLNTGECNIVSSN